MVELHTPKKIMDALPRYMSTFLSLFSGSCVCSMLAARAGASPVYACEGSEAMCQVAAATLADNGMDERVHLINKWSHQMTVGEDLPRRCVMSETDRDSANFECCKDMLDCVKYW